MRTAGTVHACGATRSKSGAMSQGRRNPRNASSSTTGMTRQEPRMRSAIHAVRSPGPTRASPSASGVPSPRDSQYPENAHRRAYEEGEGGRRGVEAGRRRRRSSSATAAAASRAPYQRSKPEAKTSVRRAAATTVMSGAT